MCATLGAYIFGKQRRTHCMQWQRDLCIVVLQVVTSADVVIQVLDARDPLGSRCAQVEQTVLQTGAQKRLVLLLNKIGEFCRGRQFVLI